MPVSVRRQYDFSGGVNATDPDDQISPNQMSDCRNVRLEGRAITERLGQTKLNTNAISANPVHSLSRFYKDDGTTRYLLGFVGTTLYEMKASPSSISRGAGSWASGNIGAASMGNNHYFADGADIQKYSGTGSTAAVASSPAANLIMSHPTANRLFAGNTGGKRVYFTALDAPDDWTTANDAGFFDIPFTQGENLKAMAVAPSGVALFFSSSSTHILQGEDYGNFLRREIDPAIGTRSPLSIAAGRGGVYFLAQNNRVYWNNGNQNIPVGKNIEGILDAGVTGEYPNAVGWVEGTRYHLAITYTGSTNNLVLVLDWTANGGQGAWVIDDQIKVRSVAIDDGLAGQVYTGDYVGFVQQQDLGVTDNGTAVNSYVDTAFDVYDEPERRKKTKRTYVKFVPSGAYDMTVSIAKDGGPFSQLALVSMAGSGSQLDSGLYGLDDPDTQLDGGETEKIQRISAIRNCRSLKHRFAISNPFKLIGYSTLVRKKFPK